MDHIVINALVKSYGQMDFIDALDKARTEYNDWGTGNDENKRGQADALGAPNHRVCEDGDGHGRKLR